MRIISFAETTPALLAGRKTCTRRAWKSSYARQFHFGARVLAYDKSPRAGGKPVAIIELSAWPVLSDKLRLPLPLTDWEAEGFAYMEEHGLALFGGATPRQVWDSWARPG